MTIELEPVTYDERMSDEDYALDDPTFDREDERARALRALDELAQGRMPEARPGQSRPVTGGRIYPPGTVPPRDPVTGARGASDIFGTPAAPQRAPQEPQRQQLAPQVLTPGAGRMLASPGNAPVAPTPEPRLQQLAPEVFDSGPQAAPPVTPPAGGAARGAGLDAGSRGALERLAQLRPELAAAMQSRPAPQSPGLGAALDASPPGEPGAEGKGGTLGKIRQLVAQRATGAPERDYTGVDIADRLLSPLRGLGRGLIAASGRSPGPRRSFGDQARARDRATDAATAQRAQAAARLQRERSGDGLAERRLSMQERGQASLEQRRDEMSARDVDREERQGRIAERTLELREQGQRPAVARLRAMQEEQERANQAAADRRDPESDASAAAREEARATAAQLRQSVGFELAPEATALLESGTAEQIEAWREDLRQTRVLRPSTHRRGGRRSGGSGSSAASAGPATPQSAWGTDADPLVRAAVEQGIDEDVARQMAAVGGRGSRTPRARLQSMVTGAQVSQGRRQRSRERTHRVTGYTRRADAPELGATARRAVRDVSVADAEFSRVASTLERDLSSLTMAERAAGVSNLGGERYRQIEHSIEVIRNQLRQINNVGNSIGAQEMAEHSMPGLTAQTTVASILANVRAARRVKHQYVAAMMDQMGYEPGGSESTPTGGAPGGGPQSDRVDMRDPDGNLVNVPRGQLSAAVAQGYEEI